MPSGRTPMNKHDQRNLHLTICVQPAEDKKIRKLAGKAGLSVSTFLRVTIRKALRL